MACTLKDPIYYLEGLVLSREAHGDRKYTKEWRIELIRKTNKHPDCNGKSCGWYQVNNCTVGYWNCDTDDILSSGIDIQAWKREAVRLSMLNKKDAMRRIGSHRHYREKSIHEILNSAW